MLFSDILLLSGASAAVLTDLSTDRIPNVLCACTAVSSLILRGSQDGFSGMLSFAGGALVPFLILAPFYRLRLIGAGDIKLLMALGSVPGPAGSLRLLLLSAAAGTLVSAMYLFSVHLTEKAAVRSSGSPSRSSNTAGGKGLRIRNAGSAKIHFSLPVFIAVLCMFVHPSFLEVLP